MQLMNRSGRRLEGNGEAELYHAEAGRVGLGDYNLRSRPIRETGNRENHMHAQKSVIQEYFPVIR